MADQTVTLRIRADADGLVTGVSLAGKETRKLGDEGERAGQRMNSGMSAARRGVQSISTQLEKAKQAAIGFASAFASIQGVRAIAAMADTWSDLTSRVSLNIDATESAADVMDRLSSIARGTYSSLELTAESFTRNATTLNALGKSTQEQLNYTEALNNALVVSGAKADAAAMVQNSLAKALAEGALRGEELNNVLNRGSRVAELLAAELGTNVTELRALGQQGAITGDVIYATLVNNMQALKDEAASMPATIGDAFTLLRNSVLQTVGVFDQQSQVSETVAEALIAVADNMGAIIKAAVGIGGTLAAAHAAAAAATLAHEVATRRAASAALAEAEAQLANLRAKGAGIISTAQLTAAENALAAAQARATAAGVGKIGMLARMGSGLMALAGGPIGVTVLALGAVAIGIKALIDAEEEREAAWRKGLKESAAQVEALRARVQALNDEYANAGRFASGGLGNVLSVQAEASAELAAKRAELKEKTDALRAAEDAYALARDRAMYAAEIGSLAAAAAASKHAKNAAHLRAEVAAAQDAVDALSGASGTLSANLAAGTPNVAAFGAMVERLKAAANGDFSALYDLPNVLSALAGGISVMADTQLGPILAEQERAFDAAKKKIDEYTKGTKAYRLEQQAQALQLAALTENGEEEVRRLRERFAEINKAIAQSETLGKAEKDAAAAARDLVRERERAAEQAADYVKKLQDEVKAFGLADEAKRRHELATLSLTDAQAKEANRLIDLIAGYERLARALEPAYAALDNLADGHADLDAQLAQGRDALAGLDQAQVAYNAAVREQNALTAQALALGPLTAEQQAEHEARLLKLRELMNQDYAIAEQQRLAGASLRAAEESTRAWQDFAGSLADAVLDGSAGVKRWWKQMIDDMKRQLIQSGILSLMQRLFGGAGGFSLAGGGGIGFGQLLGGMLGGGGTGSGALGSLFNSGSWMQAGGSLGAGFAQAVPWLAAAGGALHGYRSSGVGAAVGYGALGWVGGTAAYGAALGYGAAGIGGAVSGATGAAAGAFGAGSFIPVVGWIAAIAAAIDMISGGKLFGTKYRPESSTSTISVGEEGYSADGTLTQVRNRSLFRGRKWETHAIDPGDEARAAAEAFYAGIYDAMTGAARSLAIDVPPMIDAAIRTVTEYDKKGRVTGLKIFTDALGRSWEEAISDPNNEEEVRAATQRAASRITSEAIIAVIDAALGTTVQRAIGGTGTGPGLGGGGGGGGPGLGGRRRGDDFEQPASTLVGALDVTMATMGEASAIAERWRDDVELLAEGAQFLLLAASDIRAGVGLLGEGGTLTQITALIEELAQSGEALSDTYTRVAASAALLDQALALSGIELDKTREELVRFAVDIADAAGGLERASALWGNYFDRFYSDSERAAFALTQAQASASREFGDIGLDYADFTGEGGVAEFRRLFEAALPSLSAEAIVEWLEAAAALGIVIDATDALNAALGEAAVTAEQLASRAAILADIDSAIEDFGLTEWERQLKEIGAQQQSYIDSLVDTGMSLEDATAAAQRWGDAAREAAEAQRQSQRTAILADIDSAIEDFGLTEWERQLKEIGAQQQSYIDSLVDTGMSLEDATAAAQRWGDAAREVAEAQREATYQSALSDILTPVRDELAAAGMSDFALAMRDINRWTAETTGRLHAAAVASGRQAAAEEDLALVHQVAAQRAAAAIAQLRAAAAALVTELFGPAEGSLDAINAQIAALEGAGGAIASGAAQAGSAIDDLFARWMRGVESVQQYLDSMLLGDLSALTPAEQLAEARRQLEETQAAALGGDADALSRLPQLSDAYLRLARGYMASGQDYNDQFAWVRELLQATLDVPPPGSPEAGAAAGGGGVAYVAPSPELQALYDQRDALLAEQEAAHRMALMEQLGGMVRELIQATGEPLEDVAASIGLNLTDLAEGLGINLNDMSAATATGLVDMARMLGVDVAELASNVGVSLGSLADRQSLLNQALDATLLDVPEDIRAQLAAPLDAIRSATNEADANAALAQLEDVTGDLPAGIRDLLAPYFDFIDPTPMTTELTRLSDIYDTANEQLSATYAANALLARIADNAAAANVAADIPSYAVGTWRVPQTGPAILHAGEMVLPVPLARVLRDAGGRGGQDGGDTRALLEELQRLGERLDRIERATSSGAQDVARTIVKTGEISDRNADASRSRHAQAQRRGVTA